MSRTNHHGDKKKARLLRPWFWFQQTPSWWTRMMMTKPQRRSASTWQRNTERTALHDLYEVDDPPHGRKPHWYFW
jgi:hypothetical protein